MSRDKTRLAFSFRVFGAEIFTEGHKNATTTAPNGECLHTHTEHCKGDAPHKN